MTQQPTTIASNETCDLDVSSLLGFEGLKEDQVETSTIEETVAESLAKIGENRVSDRRLKSNIAYSGSIDGMRLYDFTYVGDDRVFTGVMAQDLLADDRRATAVSINADGFYRVDYAALGFSHLATAAMRSAGERAAAAEA